MKPILKKPADLRVIQRLHRQGVVSDEFFEVCQDTLQPEVNWLSWSKSVLLILGSILVLSGVIFFFAYNWAEMGKFLKFGLLQFSIVGCVVAYVFCKKSSLAPRILLLAASVLTGVLMAVFGQTYQTGADAYELFVGWSVLILGWVVLSNFAAHWIFWVLLVNTALILYWQQVGEPVGNYSLEGICLTIGAFNVSILCLREFFYRRGAAWLQGRWVLCLLLISSLLSFTLPALLFVVGSDEVNGLGMLAWLILVVAAFYFYRRCFPEIIALAIVVMNGCVVLLTMIGRAIVVENIGNDSGVLLLFTMIIIGVVTGAAYWLRALSQAIDQEQQTADKGEL